MITERLEILEKIECHRKRPLISYVTSIRPNMSGNMAGDAISQIIQQIETIPLENEEIDFIIISNGGDPITSLRIISLLRERFKKISVLLPYVAYSAATILALGADEIVMHPYSNLGPVDPQLTISHSNEKGIQEQLHFSSEDLINYIGFLKQDVGVTDQEYIVSAIQPLLKDIGALPIGSAKRSQQLSLSLSEKMLSLHIKDSNKARNIARALNSSYYHHGYAVGRKEAKEIGLNVLSPDKDLEKLMFELWMDYSEEMRWDEPFDVINEAMSDEKTNKLISQIPIVELPANTPPEIAQQIIINCAQQIPITTRSSIKKSISIAAIESPRLVMTFYNNIDLLFWRNADMSLGVNFTASSSGWKKEKIANNEKKK